MADKNLLWEPSKRHIQNANITLYMKHLEDVEGLHFKNYERLWQWSVTEIEGFWKSVWDFFQIKASKPYTRVLSGRTMPGADWFTGSELNYAEHVFRNILPQHPALIFQSETQPVVQISWEELHQKVAAVATSLRNMGVGKGDRVVSYMPNIPHTVMAFLACASIGAVWSSCSPDFGTRSVIDRFNQIGPKVIFAVDGYQYGGKRFDCLKEVVALQNSLPTLKRMVWVPYLNPDREPEDLEGVVTWNMLIREKGELYFEQVPFSHPLWVLYSSGTTGKPKALVHSHGGILLEFLKFLGLHVNVKPKDRFFWFSTTGWVMWNVMQGALLSGATSLLYDGNPGFPDIDVLWEFAEKTQMTGFGVSAAYLHACMNDHLHPGKTHDLEKLKTIGSTGSPLSEEGFRWVYRHVKKDVLLGSVSGGTDPCTAFLGCCPILPVRAGELQCRCLGVNAQAFDRDGNAVNEKVGELVITEPMPSMPIYLWNDPEYTRYRDSYFKMYPGKWRHGDWVKIKSNGSGVILGRSDSTINRMGVRMGSSEIYAVVEDMEEIQDSLVVGADIPGRGYYMPLFVVLKDDHLLDDDLTARIKQKIRNELSPRHVPDEIRVIDEVPQTLNHKKLEVPVKKILTGMPVQSVVNLDSIKNPESMTYFIELSRLIRTP